MIGMYISLNEENPPRSKICRMYTSMEDLWKNREHHKYFVIAMWLPGVKIGLPAFKKYCQENKKFLSLDIHDHYQGCVVLPDLVDIVNVTNDINDPDNIVQPYQEITITLDKSTYLNLLNDTKKRLTGVYYGSIPLHYNPDKSRFESIYGDIHFVPSF